MTREKTRNKKEKFVPIDFNSYVLAKIGKRIHELDKRIERLENVK